MDVAYLDTSCAVAIALGESAARRVVRRIDEFDELVSSNLFEAEVRAVLTREHVDRNPVEEVGDVSWILPDRPLSEEIARVLEAGYVRGAECWHLATALHFSPNAGEITFLTLDERQKSVAEELGFRV